MFFQCFFFLPSFFEVNGDQFGYFVSLQQFMHIWTAGVSFSVSVNYSSWQKQILFVYIHTSLIVMVFLAVSNSSIKVYSCTRTIFDLQIIFFDVHFMNIMFISFTSSGSGQSSVAGYTCINKISISDLIDFQNKNNKNISKIGHKTTLTRCLEIYKNTYIYLNNKVNLLN